MDHNHSAIRNWQIAIIAATALAVFMKLYLALTTLGTNDVLTWQSFLNNIREFGGIGTYQRPGVFGDPYNHPPFMIHVLRVLGFLSDITPLPFQFWIRLPAIIADVGSVWLLLKLKTPWLMLLLFCLCPAAILISGFHGNTDPVMVFLLLLSVYAFERFSSDWLAGLAFGMALNIKIVPLIFIPAIFFYLSNMKRRVVFFAVALAILFVASLPYIMIDPILIGHKMLGYGSTYNRWGWPLLLNFIFLPRSTLPLIDYDSAILHRFLFGYSKYMISVFVVVISWFMNRRNANKPSLFFQYGLIFSLFLTLTPGFGVQYLAWLIPFVIALGESRTIFYYASSGAYLFAIYEFWSDGTFYFANSTTHQTPTVTVFASSLLCWVSVSVASIKYLSSLTKKTDHERKITLGNDAQ
ncbi:MAG TPA: glycosyltransferase 87 family protein [Pyrinomonadaceae bacterium]|jgi:Predicted integral membrane protein|nr:glycosyltransferase 87 family protein [Pyrinomonadaceae bacterium]